MIKTRIARFNPETLVKGIVYTNVFLFAASLVLSGKNVELSLNPFTALSPSVNSLIFLGAAGTIPIDHYNEWWSLIAASWLHGGVLHILFNMTALYQIAPLVIREYGMHRMVIIYTLSGVAGFLLSYLAGVMVTIGASAAICGLIGATLFYGKSRGGVYGEAVFKQTSGWVFGLALFGLLIPNINNWGHGGGLVAGIFLAWLLGYNERKHEALWHRLFSMASIAVTGVILLWALTYACRIAF
ncbi:MAG TPA: rhomboid family intramembrane serine protease [Desulfobacteraceae bacterium]|nr:rhomboid family intramembrane serine protease [Desulfobacteraceae bacterium]